jgi:glycosyltransferase involved in cell wall biosynthesis
MTEVVHLVGREGDLHGTRLREALLRDPGVRASEVRMNFAGGARTVPNMAWKLRRTSAIIHAWDERALLAAALARPAAILFSPSTAPDPRAPWWLLPLLQLRQAQVVVSCESDRQIVETAGLDAERCHVIPPGIKLPRLGDGAHLRQKLGLLPEDRVILAVGESTRAADREQAVWAASILHVLDPRHKLLLCGRGDRAGAAAELGRKLGQPKLVITVDPSSASYEELLSVADVGLLTASKPVAPLPVLLTLAAGVPVVATEGPTAREFLRDAAAIVSPAPRVIARELLRLLENPRDRREIAERGTNHVTNHFPIDPFLDRYCSLYSRVGVAASYPSTRRLAADWWEEPRSTGGGN